APLPTPLFPYTTLFRSFGVLSAVFLLVEKLMLRVLARYVRAKGLNYRTILIVGTGRRALEVARMVTEHKYWGYKILGFVSDGHRSEEHTSELQSRVDLV